LALSIGTGVGASVLDDGGKFVHVSGETPGHFGQLDVSLDADPPVGPDGAAGSLEAYVGAGARVDWASVRVGDAPARALVRAIRVAHAIYRPTYVALAGGVGIRLGRLVDELRAAADEKLTRVARPGWTLFCGDSDYHAARGAARFAAARASAIASRD
jgi:predicted NBD/HSP70 family sugar kinase